MKGFTFYYHGKDYFYETEKTRRTEALAREILQGFSFPDNVANRTILLLKLERAECELKTLGNGKQMWDIHGDGFGGHGSFVDDGRTVVLRAELADA